MPSPEAYPAGSTRDLNQRSIFGTTTDRVDPSRSPAGGDDLAATCGIIGLADLSANCVRPQFLLLDEPTVNLDIAHQCHAVQLRQRFARHGVGAGAVVHDLSMAVRCFPRLILPADGIIVGDGPAPAVLTAETIKRVFRVQARICEDQEHRVPWRWFPV